VFETGSQVKFVFETDSQVKFVFETGSQVKFEVNLKEQFDPLNTPVDKIFQIYN
jgi:hypothetical protein